MIGALLLAVATATGGYVATYTFDRSAAVYARIATGAVLGMAVLAFAGFALALVFRGLAAPVLVLAGLVTLLPLVTSVARIVAICVAALFGTTMRTVALPFWSLVTVSEDTSGWPGAVLDSAKLPCTTSNRT